MLRDDSRQERRMVRLTVLKAAVRSERRRRRMLSGLESEENRRSLVTEVGIVASVL